jgi:hypothetical protein
MFNSLIDWHDVLQLLYYIWQLAFAAAGGWQVGAWIGYYQRRRKAIRELREHLGDRVAKIKYTEERQPYIIALIDDPELFTNQQKEG